MEIKPQKIFIYLIVIILSLAALLGMNSISAQGDEFGTILLASQPSVDFILNKVQHADNNPPTQYLIYHYWGKLFGYNDYALRVLSLIFTLFSLFIIWGIIKNLFSDISINDKLLIYLICISSPVIWVTADIVRYYSLGMLLGLLSVYVYLIWFKQQDKFSFLLYTIMATASLFYIQYLTAALIAVGQGLHFLINIKNKNKKERFVWILSQLSIIILFIPILLWNILPIISGKVNSMSNSSVEGITGLKAIPLVLFGNIYTVFTGGIPFPWDLWVTIPLFVITFYVFIEALRRKEELFSKFNIFFIFVPILLLTIFIAIVMPVIGYFRGIFRAAYLAVLILLFFASLLIKIRKKKLKNIIIVILLGINFYLITIYNLNLFSMSQTPPIKEIVSAIKQEIPANQSAAVFNPFIHGWGDATIRYLPYGYRSYFLSDHEGGLSIDSCKSLISKYKFKNISIINGNRFSSNAAEIDSYLVNNNYRIIYKKGFQKQCAYDLWFKNFIQSIKLLNLKQEKSHKYILSLRMYERKPK